MSRRPVRFRHRSKSGQRSHQPAKQAWSSRRSDRPHRPNRSKAVAPSGLRRLLRPGEAAFLGRLLRFLAVFVVIVAFAAIVGFALMRTIEAVSASARGLPDDRQLRVILSHPIAEVVRLGDGTLAAECRCAVPIPAEAMPEHLRQAVISIEDHRFATHSGIDWHGLLRAALATLSGARVEGGSTLTQQLAKTLAGSEQELPRKEREALLARQIERIYSKEEIVTLYLNRVDFGRNLFGVEQAARGYFGKPAKDLTLLESALLAGMLKAPGTYDPLANPARARERAAIVLAKMVEQGHITEAERRSALKSEIRRGKQGPLRMDAGHYLAWVLRSLGQDAKPGMQLVLGLDPWLQHAARAAVAGSWAEARQLRVGEAALVAMDTEGLIVAMIGGRDFGKSQFVRSTAPRQPGSTTKPFVYLAALEAGWLPESIVEDAPIAVGDWRPRNADRRFLGPMTLTEALAQSRNAAAVRLADNVGIERVRELIARFGLPTAAGPTFVLGATGVSPLQLSAAYATLANGGEAVSPRGTLLVLSATGRVLWEAPEAKPERIASAVSVQRLTHMLASSAAHSLGQGAAGLAGKSGTSSGPRDGWFAGFDRDITTVVWMGNDDNRPTPGLAGGGLPARVWLRFMTQATEGRP